MISQYICYITRITARQPAPPGQPALLDANDQTARLPAMHYLVQSGAIWATDELKAAAAAHAWFKQHCPGWEFVGCQIAEVTGPHPMTLDFAALAPEAQHAG